MPSMSVFTSLTWSKTMLPPPTEMPLSSQSTPSTRPVIRMVLRSTSSPSMGRQARVIPSLSASCLERLQASSYSRRPRHPASMAMWVRCPGNMPIKMGWKPKVSCRGAPPMICRARYPMRLAPAVWLLEGPCIIGPTTSNKPRLIGVNSFCYDKVLQRQRKRDSAVDVPAQRGFWVELPV